MKVLVIGEAAVSMRLFGNCLKVLKLLKFIVRRAILGLQS